MKHAEEAELALYAGGDLAPWRRMRVRAHLRRCALCRMEAARFAASRAVASEAGGDLPPGLDWSALSREMTGNILVGLEAGECVEGFARVPPPRRRGWNLALAGGAACLLLAAGVWMNFPGPQWDRLTAAFSGIVHPLPVEPQTVAAEPQSAMLEGFADRNRGDRQRRLAEADDAARPGSDRRVGQPARVGHGELR